MKNSKRKSLNKEKKKNNVNNKSPLVKTLINALISKKPKRKFLSYNSKITYKKDL